MIHRIVSVVALLMMIMALAAPAMAQVPGDLCYEVEVVNGVPVDAVTGAPCVTQDRPPVVVTPPPPPTVTTVAQPPALARTGFEMSTGALLAVGLLALGGGVLFTSSRRKRSLTE
jgi:LPXTG-motif cell wall-anchored protein